MQVRLKPDPRSTVRALGLLHGYGQRSRDWDDAAVTLDLMPGSFAVCRLESDAVVPVWASSGPFSSITRTPAELSIVCATEHVPAAAPAERGFRALAVRGPLDFGLVGVVAQLSGALAAASISIFVVSTHDTDYLFVRDTDLDRAAAALRAAQHTVVTS